MKRDEVIARLRANESELRAAGVVHVGPCGSTARGEETPASDVDLVVTFDEARNYSLVDHERVRSRLSELLGTRVDLLVQPLQKARLRGRVEAEAVLAF
jgi:predicted nucleotidyltransferase